MSHSPDELRSYRKIQNLKLISIFFFQFKQQKSEFFLKITSNCNSNLKFCNMKCKSMYVTSILHVKKKEEIYFNLNTHSFFCFFFFLCVCLGILSTAQTDFVAIPFGKPNDAFKITIKYEYTTICWFFNFQ